MSPTSNAHQWAFFRASGFEQVQLRDGSDIAALKHLDQKLWTALACPATGLEFDDATLKRIDADADGRIRAPELLATIDWLSPRLRSLDTLTQPGDTLSLSAIQDQTPEGSALLAAARQILTNIGHPGAGEISVSQAGDTAKVFADTAFNGDGVVPADAAADDDTRAAITDILSTTDAAKDRSGKDGVTQPLVDAFFDAAQAHADWWTTAEDNPALSVLGDDTAAAADALDAVRSKIDDFFARCRLAAFDARAVEALNREESAYLALAAQDLSITPDEVAGLPLARVSADATLPLTIGVNPAWTAKIGALSTKVITPLIGERSALTAADWAEVQARLAPFVAWRASKAGGVVEALGLERIRALLAGDARATISGLIAQDNALADEAKGVDDVHKLLLLRRDLFTLLNNFVTFRDFYTPGKKAIFQAGTLFLDERSCNLCIKVPDMGAHGVMAPLSRAYIAYCACERKKTGQKMTIAAAFTGGDTDFLIVGRRGVFYDRDGADWDATITKIVDAPLSIPQAFWAPYKRLLRWVESAVAKRAAASDKASDGKLTQGAQAAAAKVESGPATAPAADAAPQKSKIDVGVVAALGVAVGGIVAALGLILETFFGLGIWMPLGLAGLMMLISGPSMLIAWLKLRQRNLGPLLNANGWAVNKQARINIPFGATLTQLAQIPANAKRDLRDPYAASSMKRNIFLLLVLVAVLGGVWHQGLLDGVLPDVLDRATLIGPLP